MHTKGVVINIDCTASPDSLGLSVGNGIIHELESLCARDTRLNFGIICMYSIGTFVAIVCNILLGFILALNKIPPRVIGAIEGVHAELLEISFTLCGE